MDYSMIYWFAGAWLLIGFLYGCKIVFIEKVFEEMQEQEVDFEKDKLYNFAMNSKMKFIITCTLSGFILPLIELLFKITDKGE